MLQSIKWLIRTFTEGKFRSGIELSDREMTKDCVTEQSGFSKNVSINKFFYHFWAIFKNRHFSNLICRKKINFGSKLVGQNIISEKSTVIAMK